MSFFLFKNLLLHLFRSKLLHASMFLLVPVGLFSFICIWLQLEYRVNKVMVLYLSIFSVLQCCSLQITVEIYCELSKVRSNIVLPTPWSLNREGLIISMSHLAFQLFPIGLSHMLQKVLFIRCSLEPDTQSHPFWSL